MSGTVTEDGRYLVIGVAQGKTVNTALFYKDLATPGAPVVELLPKFDAQYDFVGNDGPVFWVQADLEAPARPGLRDRHPEARAQGLGGGHPRVGRRAPGRRASWASASSRPT